ncbi:MAG: FlgD immunoglobulin-like domain containing protein [Candidatus Cloacimonas sp.]
MFNSKITIKKMSGIKWLLVVAIIVLATPNLFSFNTGDYRTKWGGNFEDLNLWEYYNGSQWVNATQLPSSPFTSTIYIAGQNITMHSSMTIQGGLVISGTLQLVSGATLIINESVDCKIGRIETYNGSKLTINGQVTANTSNSSVVVNEGIVEVNGIINSLPPNNCNVYVNSNGKIIFGSQGSITGNCSFSNNYGSIIATANPSGLDGSLNCSGSITYNSLYLIYNGTEPQITGLKMPNQVLGIDFNNPAGISLSRNITLVNTATVYSETSLDFGLFIITSAWTGSGTFSMADNSTIATANQDGFSSTGNTGSVQVGARNYNSTGNYIFNGSTPQSTGNFNPTPTSYTVNDIVIDNPAGITFTNPITVVSTMELIEGNINNSILPDGIDGFYSPDVKKVTISKNGTLMYNFMAESLPFQNNNAFVNRKWILKGNFNGTKIITLNWNEDEDNGLNWNVHNFPKLYLSNSDEPLNTIWNPAKPREISFMAHNFPNNRDDAYYYIGRGTDDTLPVTLSSFIASQSGMSSVKITWITQSETNVMGFNILRSNQSNLDSAINLGYLTPATNTSQLRIYQYTDQVLTTGIYYYWLEIVDFNGTNSFYGPAIVEIQNTGSQSPSIPVLEGFHSIAPNPLDSDAKIFFGVPSKSVALIQVYNIKGQRVKTILNETKDSGNFSVQWDARDDRGNLLANGNYILSLNASGKVWTKKIAILH